MIKKFFNNMFGQNSVKQQIPQPSIQQLPVIQTNQLSFFVPMGSNVTTNQIGTTFPVHSQYINLINIYEENEKIISSFEDETKDIIKLLEDRIIISLNFEVQNENQKHIGLAINNYIKTMKFKSKMEDLLNE